MAQVLVLTRRDGSTEVAHIGSPYLAVVFEDVHKRTPDTAADNGWMAFYDAYDRAPENKAELMSWLKQFVATDIAEFEPPDPTAAPANGAEPNTSSPT